MTLWFPQNGVFGNFLEVLVFSSVAHTALPVPRATLHPPRAHRKLLGAVPNRRRAFPAQALSESQAETEKARFPGGAGLFCHHRSNWRNKP